MRWAVHEIETATDWWVTVVDDAFSGLPTWVRAAGIVGVPSLIAVVLVGYLMVSVTRDTRENHAQLLVNQRLMTDILASATSHELSRGQMDARIRSLLAILCINAASDEQERAACREAAR